MALFKSSNPTLGEKIFDHTGKLTDAGVMTARGTLNKLGILFLLTLATAGFAWKLAYSGVDIITYMWISVFGALGVAVITNFNKPLSAYLAPVYALFKGFAVGSISSYYNYAFEKIAPNIITQAVVLTFGVIIAMYLLYHFRIIRATQRFKAIIMTASLGICFFYLIAIGLHFANINIPFLHEGTPIGIAFSVGVVVLASLRLIVDFDRVEEGVKLNAPKYMEWFCAFALLVTIVWLYLEILNLLAKLSSRK